ncbi:MAG: XdhC family protein [candidate division Zixibacteria bacterium]|nr:XdhC family protein [candidate division Zixibacteria bacterium]MDH3936632.1 XdhC family protein [candidate division Zixibacteria bacterium]MDH4035215.1 XdhC family protein [candidate division Zixibacteria bacterium]
MDVFEAIVSHRRSGRPFVLATIIKTHGSSPRAVGARMLVFADGTITGTIGGGRFEKLVIDDCLAMHAGGSGNLFKRYRFTQNGADAIGMQCGGEAELFMELFDSPNRLVVFGAGHVGRQIVQLVQGLDFSVMVVDDRMNLLADLGPEVSTVLTDAGYEKDLPPVDEKSYVVVVSRSHQCDRAILLHAIDKNCAYIGVIGSKAKIAKHLDYLKSQGVGEDALKRLSAPIGLDIKAEGPREIAIAIVAQLVAVKNRTQID